ncbi:unnamed protein product [Adineta ricciae]|uniref:Uncharacterized protein n=1 Tax=Adineta ricciae TaxID=249248 RepID=A0A814IML8_ADIRI|nr:unnamed protein product [Adineta ricciae]
MTFRVYSICVCIVICIGVQNSADALPFKWPKELQNLKFSWENCGPSTDPIKIVSLAVGPDPIRLPVNITKPLPADIEAHVDMEKKHLHEYCPSVPPATYSVSNLVMNVTKSIPSIAEALGQDGSIFCIHVNNKTSRFKILSVELKIQFILLSLLK